MSWKESFLDHLEQIAFFLELNGANPFKIRAFSNALDTLADIDESTLKEEIESGRLTDRKGIGKGLLQVAKDFLKSQKSQELKDAQGEMPPELYRLRQVRGLGVKKIKALYEGLSIKNLGELEYACNENRLIDLPGFGQKTQEKIISEINKVKTRSHLHLLSDALNQAEEIQEILNSLKFPNYPIGDLARKSEVVSSFEFLVRTDNVQAVFDQLSEHRAISDLALDKAEGKIQFKVKGLFHVSLYCRSEESCSTYEIFKTSSPQHWQALQTFAEKKNYHLTPQGLLKNNKPHSLESSLYACLDLPIYPVESRELPPNPKSSWKPLNEKQILGGFHLHTQYSDGQNTLAEMANAAQALGWKYFGVSEHSQTAAYARGLKDEALEQQWHEIDQWNRKNGKDFFIFKGIESDILKDGGLDYSSAVLKKFDFVIASIHTRYGMTEMTKRLIEAIENPHTTMIGHISGRLLLARDPYLFDKTKVVDAAIANKVVIEFNANPHRLDFDWRDLAEACQRGLLVSLNPDAHSREGLQDIRYGLWFANKARIPHELILNTWDTEQLKSFFSKK
jgi:DNA polymerase (family 10)